MFRYENDFLTLVEVERENTHYAVLIQEQLSGINMGLKLANQFISQGYKVKDEEIQNLLLRLSVEELSNYELMVRVINLLSGGENCSPNMVETLFFNEIVITGDICTDLLSDIALMEQTTTIYSELYNQIDDIKVRELLSFIINRKESYSAELREAFNRIQREKIKKEYKTNKKPKICFSTIRPKLKENAYEEFKNTPPTFRF